MHLDLVCILLLAAISGAAGGICFGLSRGGTLTITLPHIFGRCARNEPAQIPHAASSGQEFVRIATDWDVSRQPRYGIEAGFLGHIFIGATAGIVTLALAVKLIDLDINALVPAAQQGSTSPEKTLILAIGFCILGGYAGLRLIGGLSERLIKEIEAKADESLRTSKSTELATIEKLKSENSALSYIEAAKEARVERNYQAMLDLAEKALSFRKSARGLILKAQAIRRLNDDPPNPSELGKSISILSEVTQLKDSTSYERALAWWNIACYKTLLLDEPNLGDVQEIIAALHESISLIDSFRGDVDTDKDLKRLDNNKTFSAWKAEIAPHST